MLIGGVEYNWHLNDDLNDFFYYSKIQINLKNKIPLNFNN